MSERPDAKAREAAYSAYRNSDAFDHRRRVDAAVDGYLAGLTQGIPVAITEAATEAVHGLQMGSLFNARHVAYRALSAAFSSLMSRSEEGL